MIQSGAKITVREAKSSDETFILSLSPSLAEVAKLDWHKDETVQKFQDDYIIEMLAETKVKNITLIAEKSGIALGFIHARERSDEISEEDCGTVPLLAVTEKARGTGIGKLLMTAAEDWAKAQGFRLLHLEVFSANNNAQYFYQNLGFKQESINMIKSLY
ncbi:MAG: GNAT family N-acetyltransferase [Emcibacter sp.]|nr:GNAT family N-acetyltransferase [Emcibacter sp.]